MIGKTNWEEAKKDYAAWWRKESGKPLFFTVICREPDTPTRWSGWNLAHKLDKVEENIKDFKHAYSNYIYKLHAFPLLTINLGPGILAGYVGGEVHVRPDTVWFSKNPTLRLDEDIGLDPNSWWYRKTREIANLAVEQGHDDFITGMTDLGGNLDVLSSLRGPEQLLYDFKDNPQRVMEWVGQLTKAWLKAYWDFYGVITLRQEGIGGWMGPWAPESWCPIQCDFAEMISPDMFQKFVVPDLQAIARSLRYTIYHWEVPGQFPYLDCLLSIPEVTGIQWNPGPSLEPPHSPKWFPLYRKIQEKGKLLVFCGFDLNKLDALFSAIDPKGVFISAVVSDERVLEKLGKYL